MAGLGVLGIYVLFTQGTANPVNSITDLLPLMEDGHFNLTGLGFVSLIIFNMLGFEVVSTFAGDMQNPKKEIPKAIIIGGILIAISISCQVSVSAWPFHSKNYKLTPVLLLVTKSSLILLVSPPVWPRQLLLWLAAFSSTLW